MPTPHTVPAVSALADDGTRTGPPGGAVRSRALMECAPGGVNPAPSPALRKAQPASVGLGEGSGPPPALRTGRGYPAALPASHGGRPTDKGAQGRDLYPGAR